MTLVTSSPHDLTMLDLGGAEVDEVLRVGDKSMLARGHVDARPVVIKALRSGEGFWRTTFAREIQLYRAFATHPPPVRVPGLVHTDGDAVLVVDQLPGEALDAERYPEHAVDKTALTAALEAVTAFARWNPPSGVLASVFDYPARVERYHHWGFFDDIDWVVLHTLLDEMPPPAQPGHGDPLPSNLLLTEHNGCALLDFEFTGLLLPGFDLAVLHTLLAATPEAHDRIDTLTREAGIELPFLVNQAIILAREWRLHTELPESDLRNRRLALLHRQWRRCRDRLHGQSR